LTALLIAAPAAFAGKPVKTPGVIPAAEVISAGFGCSFDVLWHPNEGAIIDFEFDGGRQARIANGDVTLTNLETGKTFIHEARYHGTYTVDPTTNEVEIVTNGAFIISFYPGDAGPYGEVAELGMLLRFVGNTRITVDLETLAYADFSYAGTMTDVCALLA